jgi:hypothetical protein
VKAVSCILELRILLEVLAMFTWREELFFTEVPSPTPFYLLSVVNESIW